MSGQRPPTPRTACVLCGETADDTEVCHGCLESGVPMEAIEQALNARETPHGR